VDQTISVAAKPPHRSGVMRVVIPLLLLGLGIGGFVLLAETAGEAEIPAPNTTRTRTMVQVQLVHLRRLRPTVPLFGRVDSTATARMKSAIQAQVREVFVAEGENVNKNTLLVQLDERELALVLEQKKAELAKTKALMDAQKRAHDYDKKDLQVERQLLELATKSLRRARKVAMKNLASQVSVDQASEQVSQKLLVVNQREKAIRNYRAERAQMLATQAGIRAQIDIAKLNIEHASIRAPFDGRIVKMHVVAGDRVNAGSDVVELFNNNRLELRAQIPDTYLHRIRMALAKSEHPTALLTVEDRAAKARLERLSGAVGSGGVDGLFRLDDPSMPLPLGRFVQLSLQLPAQDNLVAVPYQSVYGMDRIFLYQNGLMRELSVTRVGEMHKPGLSDTVLIRSSRLKEGDLVITTQLPNALDGMYVELEKNVEDAPL